MAVIGRCMRFCNVLTNYNKNLLGNAYWYNFPSVQQIAGLRRNVEEKLNLPPKPKRPLTPYFKFMAQIRPEMKKLHPKAKVTDLVKETAVRWEKIDPQYKSNLEAEYKREQEVYSKERLEYDTKLTEEQKELLRQARIERIEIKEKLKLKKKCKENNKPRKPCSAFVLFMKTRMPSRGDTEFKQFQKQIAAEWARLSESQKKPFIDEMHQQMRDYQKDMVEWERKMIKLGNTDIVRQDALIEPKQPKPKHKGKKSE